MVARKAVHIYGRYGVSDLATYGHYIGRFKRIPKIYAFDIGDELYFHANDYITIFSVGQ